MSIGARPPCIIASDVDLRAPAPREGEGHSALNSALVDVEGAAGDGVVEVRGRTPSEPGRVTICAGLIPGVPGATVMVGGLAGEDGGNVTLLWRRNGEDVPMLRILGARAPLDAAPQGQL